jgi:hypothetical protein
METQCERKIGSVIVRKTVSLRESGQVKNLNGRLRGGFNREILQPRQESRDLVLGNPLSAISHQKAVADFIEPQHGNHGLLFGKAGEDGEAVLAVGFVFKKPLERQRRVQHQITHRR